MWSPRVGPVLVGAALPFYFFSRQLVGPVGFTPPGLALVVSWGALLVRARGLDLKWPRTGFDAPVGVFLLAALLSLQVTEYQLLSGRELRALILEPILFFWLLHTFRGSAPLALGGFLASATVAAAVAIVQVPLGFGGTVAEGVRRAQAWYPSANHLALMLGRAWPFFVAAGLSGVHWLWVPAAVVGVALVLAFSTGGWLGALAGALVVIYCLGRRGLALRFGAAAALALVAISAAAIVGVLPERLNPLRQTGGFRVDLWVSSLQMIRDHPLLGVGLDNFAYLYQQVYLREGAAAEPNLSHPHNWILHTWLQLGLLGLAAFVWLVARAWKLAQRTRASWPIAGALGATADLLVHGFIDNSYFLVDLAFVFWLALALVENSRSGSDV
jgi:O-antigen ligase